MDRILWFWYESVSVVRHVFPWDFRAEIDFSVFSSRVVIIVWENVGVQILSPLNPHLGGPFQSGTPNTENVHISDGNKPILMILKLFWGFSMMLILFLALQNQLINFWWG